MAKKRVKKQSQKRQQKKPENLITYIAVVLDKSGSMMSSINETITSFNREVHDTIVKTKPCDDNKVMVSLVTFNHNIDPQFFNVDIGEKPHIVPILDTKNYFPDGQTAMFDAVSYTIDRLEKETDKDPTKNIAYLVLVISDGAENASIKITSEALAEKVQRVQSTDKWTFVYVGSKQDLSKVRETLKFKSANTMEYNDADLVSTYSVLGSSITSYTNTRNLTGKTTTDTFFKDQDDVENKKKDK